MSLKSLLLKVVFVCAIFVVSFFILSQFANDTPKHSKVSQISPTSKSENIEKSDDSAYISGRGDRWDAVVNDVYDEVGEEAGLSQKEIDAMLRAME